MSYRPLARQGTSLVTGAGTCPSCLGSRGQGETTPFANPRAQSEAFGHYLGREFGASGSAKAAPAAVNRRRGVSPPRGWGRPLVLAPQQYDRLACANPAPVGGAAVPGRGAVTHTVPPRACGAMHREGLQARPPRRRALGRRRRRPMPLARWRTRRLRDQGGPLRPCRERSPHRGGRQRRRRRRRPQRRSRQRRRRGRESRAPPRARNPRSRRQRPGRPPARRLCRVRGERRRPRGPSECAMRGPACARETFNDGPPCLVLANGEHEAGVLGRR